ncbi:MAG: zinc-binding dehydrogenase [Bacteroidaceae bacterium]|nr:zinc-binding dehydrogenase [Bacteroidaceae bacterium]
MRAIQINGCCQASELHVCEIPLPEIRNGWVLVRVYAAGMNHSEVLLRLFEADHDYIHKPVVPGIECVGEVADPSDSDMKIGDRVIALMGGMGRSFNGSYEEFVLLPRTHVFKVNTDLDWISLAAIPETYYTAYGSLTESLLLQKDDILLVRGATSTVGEAAIQLAKAMGAHVVAACRRESSFEELIQLGAEECVVDNERLCDYNFKKRPNKILELVGPKTLHDSMLTVSHPGYVCNTGILGNVFSVQNFDPIKYIPNGVFLSGFFSNSPTQQQIDQIFDLIDRHHIRPLYKQVFTLEQISMAHEVLERGAGGKIILQVVK